MAKILSLSPSPRRYSCTSEERPRKYIPRSPSSLTLKAQECPSTPLNKARDRRHSVSDFRGLPPSFTTEAIEPRKPLTQEELAYAQNVAYVQQRVDTFVADFKNSPEQRTQTCEDMISLTSTLKDNDQKNELGHFFANILKDLSPDDLDNILSYIQSAMFNVSFDGDDISFVKKAYADAAEKNNLPKNNIWHKAILET